MRNYSIGIIAAGIMALGAGSALAAPSQADRTFARRAATAGLAEVQEGQLAQQMAGSQQVKDFAQRMVTDHTQANDALRQVAAQENLTLPTAPNKQQTAQMQTLQGDKGPAFDNAYIKDQVMDHRRVVAAFRQEAQNGQDPGLKAFAQKYLPVLEQHLQMAQSLKTAS